VSAAPAILLTGVTGFVGGATAARLLAARPDVRLVLVVRSDTVADGLARVRRSLARFDEPRDGPPLADRVRIIPGDLVDRATLESPELDSVTHVLHLAANTSFRSVRGVRRTNVLGALALAHRMRRDRALERFVHVSTAWVCGRSPSSVVREEDAPTLETEHLVEYTSSKAECELLLERTAPELPLVVARPSVVVGHTKLGCAPSSSIFWYYRALDLLRRTVVAPEKRRDVVPVDWVAQALETLLLKPRLGHRRYHVSAGETSAVSWREIGAAFDEVHGPRPDEPLRLVDVATLRGERGRLAALLGPGDEERLLTAIELFARFTESAVEVFDNRRLLDEGVPAPPPFTSYLKTCATNPPRRGVHDQLVDEV
jgi:nucleoside-diphosphate-sugar epimerase